MKLESIKKYSFRWSEIIANSSILLKNIKLKLSKEKPWQWKLPEITAINRKLLTVEVSDISEPVLSHGPLVHVSKHFGNSLKIFHMSHCDIDDHTFREILRNSLVLEELSLTEVKINKRLPVWQTVSMRKLKKITVVHCDWSIFLLVKAQIKNLSVNSYLDEGSRNHLADFLMVQYKLEHLALNGTSARVLFQKNDVTRETHFNLKSFHLNHGYGKNSTNANWNITSFLAIHEDSLIEIEISGPHCDHINAFIIANLNNIERLQIDARSLPKYPEFYEIIESSDQGALKELSLRGFFSNQEAIKKILMKYPALEKLELLDWGKNDVGQLICFISKQFPDLKQLSITEVGHSDINKFKSLKDFSVTYIRELTPLRKFIKFNQTIERLKIGLIYIGQASSDFFRDLRDLENVKHLSCGGNRKALNSIMLSVEQNKPKNLKTLELSLISDDITVPSHGKSIKINLT